MTGHWVDQPRDAHGRWTKQAGSYGSSLDLGTGGQIALGVAAVAPTALLLGVAPKVAVFRTAVKVSEIGIKVAKGGAIKQTIAGTTRVTQAGPLRAATLYRASSKEKVARRSVLPGVTTRKIVSRGKVGQAGPSGLIPSGDSLITTTRKSPFKPHSTMYDYKGSRVMAARPKPVMAASDQLAKSKTIQRWDRLWGKGKSNKKGLGPRGRLY